MPTRGHSPGSVIDRQFGSGMRFCNGDTLVARITPCLENGKTAYVDFLEPNQIGWGSTEYIVLRPKPPLPPEYAYCLARSTPFRKFAIQRMTGSSGRQRVPAESLTQFKVAIPSERIADEFGKHARSLIKRAGEAAEQSRTLAALRNTLLPKLISGELRLRDAERIVGREL
jgi:type I restriction enzyme, S subunit